MNDEAALLAAITAQPAEDTPRLAYADWLDEHEAPIQAEFVRTQCRLASGSAADADHPDALERYAEVAAQFAPFVKHTVPELPPGFAFEPNLDRDADHFRRGFLHTVQGEWNWYDPTGAEDAAGRMCDGLPKLIATTTARHLRLMNLRGDAVAGFLAAPGAEAVTGLTVQPSDWGEGGLILMRGVANSRAAPNLERLALPTYMSAAALATLAAAKFERFTHLELPMLHGRVRDLRVVTAAPWFAGLRFVRAGASERPLESALLEALARLPHLDALDVRFQHAHTTDAFGSARGFRSLARLLYWLPRDRTSAGAELLARGTFPRLAELELWGVRSSALVSLAKAKWLPQLRVLSLRHGALSDRAVAGLAKSPAAAHLRILRLDNVPVGRAAFAALGAGERFPSLTTLEIATTDARKMTAADVAAFASNLSLPRVRHLNLSGWPLGDDGAKALAANPALANLTRLSVAGCGVGEKGLGALVRSRHLQQLIELDVTNNKLTTAAALLNADRLPRLAAARLAGNPIPQTAHRKLHGARGLAV